MTFTAVGSLTESETTPSGNTTTLSLTTHANGNIVLLSVVTDPSGGSAATAVTGGGCSWSLLSSTYSLPFLYGGAGGFGNIWLGTVTSAGSGTVTVTTGTATCNHVRMNADEFATSVGSVALDAQGDVSVSGTNSWATLTPSGSGRLYFGYCEDSGSAVSGSTPGFVYQVDGHGNGTGYCLSVSSAYTPVWGDSGQQAGVMVLVKEVTASSAHAAVLTPVPPWPVIRAAFY